MVANAGQTPVRARPSPPIPRDVTGSLATYLHGFSLWCQQSFAARVSANTALPAILLQSPAGKVFSVTVSDAGALSTTAVPLGGGESALPFARVIP